MYLTIQEFADSQKPPVSRKTVERWIREGKLTYELTVSGRKRITGVKKMTMRDQLIKNGVNNLHVFGYNHATIDNIMTDDIYREFFKSMLEESREEVINNERLVKVIDGLLEEIKA